MLFFFIISNITIEGYDLRCRLLQFNIELALGTTPISKALYKMAPTKLQELKKLLQKLLENGFIRLSHSL